MNALGQAPVGSCEELRQSIRRMQAYQEAAAVQISRREMVGRYLDSVAGGHPSAWDREIEHLKEEMRARGLLIARTRDELARCLPRIAAGRAGSFLPVSFGYLPGFAAPFGVAIETARRAAARVPRRLPVPIPGGGMSLPGSYY
jgi:hypothetical protein